MSVNNLKLDDVAVECRNCTKCALGRRIYNGVLSNMPLDQTRGATYVLVAGAPTIDDIDGGGIFKSHYFIKFENALYETTGLVRGDIYMTNVCKCCLYGVRQPSEGELRKCSDYLTRELEAMRPNLIISLGKVAFKALTGVDNLDKWHGKKLFSQKYRTYVFPMQTPTTKRCASAEAMAPLVEDLKLLAKELRGEVSCQNE